MSCTTLAPNNIAASSATRHACRMSSHHVVALRGAVVASAWQTWAPVASVVIASLCFLIAWANRRTSKKTLELSTAQEDRRKARLDLSLNQAIARRTAGVAQRLMALRVEGWGCLTGVSLG